ncbi:hypothetical protein [Celeribacter litoreus]|uniref:hypothetical protein n=1 Tax=Celeribacter litoreus TaxID=2876714 RepID=UPI001CCDC84E|nr:hypothetical protein [Celeribacter litoreus]MCA0044575.1 hypothetical protein [Celeribacter litoreus]
MKKILMLYAAILTAAGFAVVLLGPRPALLLMLGAIALMALMISGTFFWLWRVRATPLALGMSLSWAGSGLTLGWLWGVQSAEAATRSGDLAALFAFLSLLMAGAVLHFSVIQGTFGFSGLRFLWPVLGAWSVSFGVLLLF